jgi:polyisoprenoid-binding protein YceI
MLCPPGLSLNRILYQAIAATLLLAFSVLAETYSIDKTHSSVSFSIRHLVSRVSGRFNDFSGTIQYDPAAPEKSQVEAVVQMASIDTDNEKRDGHLKSPDFFDVTQYPVVTFKSTKSEKQGDLLIVTGDLTMHGVTKSIVMPVEILGIGTHPMRDNAPVAGFASQAVLKRSEFGVNSWTDPAKVLGDEVSVTLAIEAVGKAPGK